MLKYWPVCSEKTSSFQFSYATSQSIYSGVLCYLLLFWKIIQKWKRSEKEVQGEEEGKQQRKSRLSKHWRMGPREKCTGPLGPDAGWKWGVWTQMLLLLFNHSGVWRQGWVRLGGRRTAQSVPLSCNTAPLHPSPIDKALPAQGNRCLYTCICTQGGALFFCLQYHRCNQPLWRWVTTLTVRSCLQQRNHGSHMKCLYMRKKAWKVTSSLYQEGGFSDMLLFLVNFCWDFFLGRWSHCLYRLFYIPFLSHPDILFAIVGEILMFAGLDLWVGLVQMSWLWNSVFTIIYYPSPKPSSSPVNSLFMAVTSKFSGFHNSWQTAVFHNSFIVIFLQFAQMKWSTGRDFQ